MEILLFTVQVSTIMVNLTILVTFLKARSDK